MRVARVVSVGKVVTKETTVRARRIAEARENRIEKPKNNIVFTFDTIMLFKLLYPFSPFMN